MIPLYDEAPYSRGRAYIVWFLIIANASFFFYSLTEIGLQAAINEYGMVPAEIIRGERMETVLTSMFTHAGILHLVLNLWFLWIFGDNVERKFGSIKFLFFYLFAGVIAAITHIVFAAEELQRVPVVGASGAVSGTLGAYLVLFPHNRVRAFFLIFFYPVLFYLPAYMYIGIWLFLQIFYMGAITGVAYEAHIGGFFAGMIISALMLWRR